MIDSETLIIRNSKNDYFFPFIAQDYNVVSTMNSVKEYYFFKMTSFAGLNFPLIFQGWKHDIKKYNKIIIFDYGWMPGITDYIKKYNPKCCIHLFFFNVITNTQHQLMLNDKNVDKFWSFDSGDVKKYDINYNTPMYTNKILSFLPLNKKTGKDIVFVGKAKNRENLIRAIQDECLTQGLLTDFYIIKKESDYINYIDYLKYVVNAKCILDVTNENQAGLTLRFMEALFLSKKLITNNISVKKYNFYNPNNIFIWGIDDNKSLAEFIESPYIKPNEADINYYDMDEWIDRFV